MQILWILFFFEPFEIEFVWEYQKKVLELEERSRGDGGGIKEWVLDTLEKFEFDIEHVEHSIIKMQGFIRRELKTAIEFFKKVELLEEKKYVDASELFCLFTKS